MFFTWYSENRHFKSGSDIKGQIAPFLIVIMVILLIAAMATINIGKVGLDKTYTANAADAGALAAASVMAMALNSVAEANEGLFNTAAYYYCLEQAIWDRLEDNLWTEILWLLAADILLLITIFVMIYYGYGVCGGIVYWYLGVILGILCYAANVCITYAASVLPPIAADLSALISLLEQHYEATHEILCSIIEAMDAAPGQAEEAAYGYAFSNAGISSKLSPSQQSAFSDWMDDEGYTSGSYSWQDKLGQGHTVSVQLNVPSVSGYGVLWNPYTLSYATAQLQECLDLVNKTLEMLNKDMKHIVKAAVYFGIVAGLYFIAQKVMGIDIWGPILALILCLIAIALCIIAEYWVIMVFIDIIKAIFDFYDIQDKVEDLKENIDPSMFDEATISSCSGADDRFVLQISEVYIDLYATVTVTSTNPSVNTGLWNFSYPAITSSSTAYFGGGDVGSFDASYAPKLTGGN